MILVQNNMTDPKKNGADLEKSKLPTASLGGTIESLEFKLKMMIDAVEHIKTEIKEIQESQNRMESRQIFQLNNKKYLLKEPEKRINIDHSEPFPDVPKKIKINIQTREVSCQNKKVILNYSQMMLLKIAVDEGLSKIHWLWGYVLFPRWRAGEIQNPKLAFSVFISRLNKALKNITEAELFDRATEGCHPFKCDEFERENLSAQNLMVEVRQYQELLAFWPRLGHFVKIDPREKHHLHHIENILKAKLDELEKNASGFKDKDDLLRILDGIKTCQIDREKWTSLYCQLSESLSLMNRDGLGTEIRFFLDIIDNLKNWIMGKIFSWRIDIDPKTIPPLCLSFLMELIAKLPVYHFKSIYALKKYIKKSANQIWEQMVCEKYDMTPTLFRYVGMLSEISKYLCIKFQKNCSHLETIDLLGQIHKNGESRERFVQMLFYTLKKNGGKVTKNNLRIELKKMGFFSWEPDKAEEVKGAIMKIQSKIFD